MMDIKEEILAQMDSALRPEFDKAIDNTIEGAFKEDVKTLGFMVANSIKCQWEVMKPHLFYAYCLGVKAQEAKAQAVPEGFVLVPREMQWHKADDLACLEWGRYVGLFCSENRDMSALQVEEFRLRWCKNKANKIMSDYKAMIAAQEPAND